MKKLIEIQGGEGGKDSKLFVQDLMAAYLKYAQLMNWKTNLLYKKEGKVGLEFSGKNLNVLHKEAGKHVVQRIPPTENKGRRHTSTIVVTVLDIDADNITPLDLGLVEITTQRGHGPGGQHQNKTDSAVRVRYNGPSGLEEVFINGRSQHKNKQLALDILAAKVYNKEKAKQQKLRSKDKKVQYDGGGRANKIRTYNFMNDRAVDHRTNKKISLKKIMRGNFNLF